MQNVQILHVLPSPGIEEIHSMSDGFECFGLVPRLGYHPMAAN